MKFAAEIRNVETLETHNHEIDGATAQSAHKSLFMNTLTNNEEIVRMFDIEGHLVFEDGRGFLV